MREDSLIFRPPNPQAKANFLSILTFWYTIKTFNKAKKSDFNEDNLPLPLKEHKSSYLGEKLAILWQKEVEKAKKSGKPPKISSALFKCFLWDIIALSIAVVILDLVVKISQPLFLKLLLRYYATDNTEKSNNQTQSSQHTYFMRLFHLYENPGHTSKEEAIFFTFGVIISSGMSIAITHPYLMGVMHLGMKMRIACCSLVYRKALRVRLEFAGATMIGNVMNLISNDVNRFDNGVMFLPYIWVCPIQITLITYFIYMEMGLAGVYGIISLICVIPLQLWLALRLMTLRSKTAFKTDERIRETNEMIQAIQVLKMYTWEEVFMKIIRNSRAQEVRLIAQIGYIKGVLMSFIIFTFRFCIFVTIIAYVYSGGIVSAEKIFVLIAFLLILRQTVTVYYPQSLAQGAELIVSLSRLEEFLMLPESSVGDPIPFNPRYYKDMDPKQVAKSKRESEVPLGGVLNIAGASVKINDDVILQDITLEVVPGMLTVVIGAVGSGKSSLLHLLLGELHHFEGSVNVKGIISYASQEPWLFAGTIRQNILFGKRFDRMRYREVCFVCALNTDFELLPEGDNTFVGEKGTSLSGGQRARVNLARAIYTEADIYLLDDPLSAVDTHVGQHLFEECISVYLSDKIVILVTHQLQYLEDVEQIILLKDGIIQAKGDYNHLKDAGLDFSHLMAEQLDLTDDRAQKVNKDKRTTLSKIAADITKRSISVSTFIDKENEQPAVRRVAKEIHPVGGVGFGVYKEYMKAGSNYFGIFLLFFLFLATQIVASCGDYYISVWIKEEEANFEAKHTPLENRNTYIYIYTCMIITCILVALLRSMYFFRSCSRASFKLHNEMFRGVVETRMSFFYSHNSGEILNRFSKDMGAVDEILPNALIDTIQIFLNLVGVILVLAIINPYLLIPTALIIIIFYYLRKLYLTISNNIKRLEDSAKSPVFVHINSTLQGISTIRSNGAGQILTREFDKHQDIHSSAWFTFISTSRAFGYCLDLICIVYIGVVAFDFLLMPTYDSFVGLAITQTLSLTGLFQWGLRQSVDIENQMVSTDRILEYVKLEAEPDLKSFPADKPPPNWPESGKIEYSHAFMTYGPLGAHVLRDVTFVIQDKEKVGIVGRTGAGKSSLVATLFRLAYFYGEVRIDNLDISQLSLQDLRRKISIIPQEPVLFSGTLQYNLDPYSEYDEDWIMKVLIDLENKDALTHGKECLEHQIIEGGVNVSIGQRQIICLARALLRNNRIIVMDEATANIDAKTDKFIQSIIRSKFASCTVLTIAHRLHTIMDSDKILVMDAGQVAEFDHPHILLQNPQGIFTGMVEKTGSHMADNLRKVAQRTYETQVKTE